MGEADQQNKAPRDRKGNPIAAHVRMLSHSTFNIAHLVRSSLLILGPDRYVTNVISMRSGHSVVNVDG
eukprot:9480364-Pyramimonas_sp.AAC.1